MKNIMDTKLQESINLHSTWIETNGNSGSQLAIEDIDLSKLDLSRLNLSNAIIPGSNFNNSDLTKADLSCANLASATFEFANLSNSDLTKSILIILF